MRALQDAAKTGGGEFDTSGVAISIEEKVTPFSTVIVGGIERTTVNEFPNEIIDRFFEHWKARKEHYKSLYGNSVDAVMIGHVHADRDDGMGGVVSQSVIEWATTQDAPVFTNFGSSQYRLGSKHWQGLLNSLCSFQLDIGEMREFCNRLGAEKSKLDGILDWFRERCTVVITMERLGAIAQRKGSSNVVLGWPYDLRTAEIRDPTGAGDAFAAGFVASALRNPMSTDERLEGAVGRARLWGAYACTTESGAGQCPSAEQLREFESKHKDLLRPRIQPIDEARPMLRLLDRVFQ